MQLINKKGRLFGLINILDLLIILIAVAVLAGGFYLYKSRNAASSQPTTPIETDIELVLTKEQAEAIEIGQTVTNNQNGSVLGVIYDKKVSEQVSVFSDQNKGEFVQNVVPGKYNVVISLNSDALVEADRITISGLEINIGRPTSIKCGFIGSGYIIGIRLPE